MRINEALDNYLRQLAGDGRSKHTLDQARRHVRLFATWLASTEHSGAIEDVRHEELAGFCASNVMGLRADGGVRKPTSANALRSSLRAFFAYTHDAGYVSTNPARLVRRARCGSPQPKAPPKGSSTTLLAMLERASLPVERRDRALFHVLLRCGLRVGSAVGLDVGDVDLDQGNLILRQMKNDDQDVAFVPRETVAILRDHIAGRTSGPLFVAAHGGRLSTRQVQRRLEIWRERAGIERRFGPHSLRHEFAMRLMRSTSNLALVGRALCHRSITSTSIYARADDHSVRAALED